MALLLEGTKEKVLELLRARPLTAKEVAEALGLSRAAVGKHLQDLEARGLVRSEVRRCSGRGRPYRLYRAQDGESPYALLCRDVLQGLEKALGKEGVVAFLAQRNLSRLAPLDLRGLPLKEKLTRLARRLNEEGYEAEVVEEEGRLYLCQRAAPSWPSPGSTRPCARGSFWPTRSFWACPWCGRSGSPRGEAVAATG
jgi:predicted ArsR family transcriptional regulator